MRHVEPRWSERLIPSLVSDSATVSLVSDSVIRLRTDVFDDLCRDKGLRKQKDISAELGISSSQLGKVRAGTSQPGSKFIDRSLEVLGVPYRALFTKRAA